MLILGDNVDNKQLHNPLEAWFNNVATVSMQVAFVAATKCF